VCILVRSLGKNYMTRIRNRPASDGGVVVEGTSTWKEEALDEEPTLRYCSVACGGD